MFNLINYGANPINWAKIWNCDLLLKLLVHPNILNPICSIIVLFFSHYFWCLNGILMVCLDKLCMQKHLMIRLCLFFKLALFLTNKDKRFRKCFLDNNRLLDIMMVHTHKTESPNGSNIIYMTVFNLNILLKNKWDILGHIASRCFAFFSGRWLHWHQLKIKVPQMPVSK